MAFGKRKNEPSIDGFGPLDTLIAGSQTLEESERIWVSRLLLDDSFVNSAIRDFTSLPTDEIQRLSEVARLGNAYARYLVQKPSLSSSDELKESRRLVSNILNCEPDQLDGDKNVEGIALSCAAMRGGVRMLQIRREDKSLSAFAFVVPLIRFACVRNNKFEA
jgi:hypothetical protein